MRENRRYSIGGRIITFNALRNRALNKTLYLNGKHPTGLCDHCQGEESVEYAVMNCSCYQRKRNDMVDELREVGVEEVTFKKIISAEEDNMG